MTAVTSLFERRHEELDAAHAVDLGDVSRAPGGVDAHLHPLACQRRVSQQRGPAASGAEAVCATAASRTSMWSLMLLAAALPGRGRTRERSG